MSGNIVEGWLRSLNLVQYTQSFLDNGYDDLEVCKQIGEADLDAIGVHPVEDRERLLRAVRVLKEEGGTAVYFTLEETAAADPAATELSSLPLRASVEDGDSGGGSSGGGVGAAARRLDAYDVGKSALLTYPRVQLAHILKDKLHEDDVDLGNPPYTTSELRPCRSSLMALAIKYAEDLKTHFADVIDRLEELWQLTRAHENYTVRTDALLQCACKDCTTMCNSPVPHLYGGSLYGMGARTAPPPLPSCPPPSTSHVDRQLGGYVRGDNYAHQNYVAMDGDGKFSSESDSKKKSSTFGKFLRNIGFRRSGRKSGYKQHQGDPNAYEISMSEEDRIALMVMVKEGTISTDTALEVVRRFEDDKRKEAFSSRDDDSKENVDMQVAEAQAGKKNTGKKKKSGAKPIKSQSAVYSGDGPRCHICRQIMLAEGYEVPVQPQVYGDQDYIYECCRHRRVHSVSHIEMQNSVHSPQFSRALSCSPTSRHPPGLPLPAGAQMGGQPHANYPRIYSPILAQAPPPPRFPTHPSLPPSMELLRERISGKAQLFLPKTTSRTSLLSSESECSDYVGQAQLRADYAAAHNEAVASCSQSTLSMSSDNSQALTHYHTLNSDLRHRGPRPPFHRSASCSPGDDGGSSENEDQDNIHLLGADSRGENSSASAKLSGRLKDMKSELKRKVMRSREARASGENGVVQGEISSPHLSSNRCHQRSSDRGDSEIVADKQISDVIARATVHTDFSPAKHEKDLLTLKKGDVVEVLSMGEAGVWVGRLDGQLGKFPPSHVAIVQDGQALISLLERPRGHRDMQKARAQTVEELLHRIGLQHLTNVFVTNGFELLETFAELDENDLDALGIQDHDHRAKLLTAAQLLRESSENFYGWVSHRPAGQVAASPLYLSSHSGQGMSTVQSASAIYGMGHHRRAHHRHMCRTCGKPKIAPPAVVSQQPGTSSETPVAAGSGERESERSDRDTDKSDREYTEEDREVCAITKAGDGSRPSKGAKVASSGLDKAPACAGGNVISPCCHACIYASTSAASGTILPSQNNLDGEHIDPLNPDLSFIYGLASQPRQKAKPAPPPRLPGVSVLSSPGSGPVSPSSRKRDAEIQASRKESNRSPSGSRSKTPSQESPHSPRSSSSRKESPYSRRGGSSNDESPCGRRGFPSGDEAHYGRCRVHPHSCDESPYARRVAHPHEENPSARRVAGSCEENPYGRCRIHSGESDGKGRSASSQPPAVPLYGSGQWTLTESMYSSGHLGFGRRTSSESPYGYSSSRRKSGDGPHVPGHSLYLSGHRSISESGYNQAWGLKNVSRSLIPLVTTKLSAEKIALCEAPYSTETGGCGVPPLLVQRYAEELRQDLDSIALVLEHVRLQQLQQLGKSGVPNERLAELCGTACDLRISSVGDFLTSIGLPMYAEVLASGEFGTLDVLLSVSEEQLSQATGADSRHLQRLIHALDWVRQKLASPTRARTKGDNFTDKV